MIETRDQMLVPACEDLRPPFALFVGTNAGWRRIEETSRPQAQVMLLRREARMADVLGFLGVGATPVQGLAVNGRPVTVYAKTLGPGQSASVNFLASMIIGQPAAGPVVILDDLRLS